MTATKTVVHTPLTANTDAYLLVTEYVEARDKTTALEAFKARVSANLRKVAENNGGNFILGDVGVTLKPTGGASYKRPSYSALREQFPSLFDTFTTPNRNVKVTGITYPAAEPEFPTTLQGKLTALTETNAELRRLAEVRKHAAARLKEFTDQTGTWAFSDGVSITFTNAARSVDWETIKAEHPTAYASVLNEVTVPRSTYPAAMSAKQLAALTADDN